MDEDDELSPDEDERRMGDRRSSSNSAGSSSDDDDFRRKSKKGRRRIGEGRSQSLKPVSFVAAAEVWRKVESESDEEEEEELLNGKMRRPGLRGPSNSILGRPSTSEYDDDTAENLDGDERLGSLHPSSSMKPQQHQVATSSSGASVLFRQGATQKTSIDKDFFGRDLPSSRIEHDPANKAAKDAANHQIKMSLRAATLSSSSFRESMDEDISSSVVVGTRKKFGGAAGAEISGLSTSGSRKKPLTSDGGESGFSAMALKYMQKHNFTGRLGKNEQGISAPIEVKARPDGAGLGSVKEASSLPANQANTAHLEKIRLQAEAKEAMQRRLVHKELDLYRIWRKTTKESQPEYADTVIARAASEESSGNLVLSQMDRAVFFWTERTDSLKREIAVAESIAQMTKKDRAETQHELQQIAERTSTLAEIIRCLEPVTCTRKISPALAKSCLEEIQQEFPVETLEDYELSRLPSLLVKQCIQDHWDSDQDYCLDFVEAMSALVGGFFSQTTSSAGILGILVKLVVPRLNKLADEWRISNDPSGLALAYLPWLPYLVPALDSVLIAPVKALERELTSSWSDLTKIAELKSLVQSWRDVCGGDEFVHELMARSFGERLFDSRDVPLVRAWYDQGLVSLDDFACITEGALQDFIRDEHGEFVSALDQYAIARAARAYSAFKSFFPLESLKDSCCRGRVRALFQYALELLRQRMDGGDSVAVTDAIEPKPKSFADAWYRNRVVMKAKPVQVAADFSASGTLQQTVEQVADSAGKDFYVHPADKKVDGKKVYVFGKVFCYFDSGVIFATKTIKGGEEWKPVSLETLLHMG